MTQRILLATLIAAASLAAQPADAVEGPFRRTISYQSKRDLFYNFYEGPEPSGVTAEMYVSPLPTPPHVGHVYTTYQPLMPHELLYRHTRSHYAYAPGAGWSRAKVRYRTAGLRLDHLWWSLNPNY